MKNILRRLHLAGSQDEASEGSSVSPKARSRLLFSDISPEPRPLSGFSGWVTVAKHTFQQGGSPKHKKHDTKDATKDDISETSCNENTETDAKVEDDEELTLTASQVGLTGSSFVETPSSAKEHKSSDSSCVGDKEAQGTAFEKVRTAALQLSSDQALFLQDEELQVRVAMALSVQDDPEAAAIETAKDLSLGSELSLSNSTGEVLAYRYWKYNALGYDDKVLDGFYDVYGVKSDTVSDTMPALVDLQETPVSETITWEVVLVNRATDQDLVELEQRAISIAGSSKGTPVSGSKRSALAHKIAALVADKMGGQVINENFLHKRWRTSSMELRVSSNNVVLPLGRLQIGLARHRALLFKVLADVVGIPCQLVKGKPYTGSDQGAVNIVKLDAGREYIIDLMGVPGTLLPSDVCGNVSSYSFHNKVQDSPVPDHMIGIGGEVHAVAKGPKGMASLLDKAASFNSREGKCVERHESDPTDPGLKELPDLPKRSTGVKTGSHWRSPSWTEGISLPAARDMKVKDVSQYMMDAAKENPRLAQKLHDVLLESGVAAPPDLFSEISPKQLQAQVNEERKALDEKHVGQAIKGNAVRTKERSSVGPGRPPLPVLPPYSPSLEERNKDRLQRLESVEGLGDRHPLDLSGSNASPVSSPSSSASSGAAVVQSCSSVLPAAATVNLVQESFPPQVFKRVPVAAAAAATAAVVASSMVVAATKSENVEDPTIEVPVAAAATATAAVVVATSAVVGKRLDLSAFEPIKGEFSEKVGGEDASQRMKEREAHVKFAETNSTDGQGGGAVSDKFPEEERVSDKSSGSLSAKSDQLLEDVLELEILWEELVIGERIGLGSYGEVYRGEWHGTEVAVKKFLDQDLSGDAFDEFRSEVQLMKRMRHPNVVLFMGAVMRSPNLSIVTEFLPRGSLYRLIHRCNNQLDERRRMRMALDVARGMNYLHNSTPVIVHRDLKSPNLLVDKNWVVKVCDFGLSRLKHNTFLSSKSTAGTPEWMAPEVLRNEPSNEKCDVFSFGVILWELATLQQPWAGMNPMQVVGAVGFQQRTLDIPEDMDPVIVNIIRQCWQSDPAARPSFAEIMATLKLLQKPLTHAQMTRS